MLRNINLSHCILCRTQHSDRSSLLCSPCNKSLPRISHYCDQCGNILPDHTPYLCRHCLKKTAIFDGAFSLFHYKPPIDYFIKQLKFQHQLLYADFLGNKMADALAEHAKQITTNLTTPDVILPVPLHSTRIRNRGFNQALEIAKPIAKKLRIPLITNELIRLHHTQAQTELNARERRNNLKNSFFYQPSSHTAHYKNIAVIDDVMTTGTTLHEITKVLKQHPSVENVYVWVCACVNDAN